MHNARNRNYIRLDLSYNIVIEKYFVELLNKRKEKKAAIVVTTLFRIALEINEEEFLR